MFILVFSSSFLLACSQTTTELKIALDIEDEGRYNELFTYFTETTGYEISATYGEDVSKLIGTSDEPDIIKTSTTVILSMKDSLLDLTDLIEEDSEVATDNYLDSIMEALTIEGKVYALPTSINTSLLYYNKTLFDESADELRTALHLSTTASVYPQDNWDYNDYQEAGVVLSKYTVSNNEDIVYSQFGAETQLNWWGEWLVYINQMGGQFYEPESDDHVLAITSPQAIAATQFYVKKAMGDATEKFGPNAIELSSYFSFLGGNVAMIFGGHMGDWFSYEAIGLDWDIQVLPTPVGNSDAKGGEISADAFGISVRSQQVEAAFSFLKIWAGETGALKMYQYNKVGALKNMEELIATLPASEQKTIDISVVFDAIDKAIVLPNEKDFSKVMREMVMTELYRLMYSGRGSETDIVAVLTRIKTNVDQYYQNVYE
jgi:ABC-type glycerol-3-phosphate transport system substrate-binding protein